MKLNIKTVFSSLLSTLSNHLKNRLKLIVIALLILNVVLGSYFALRYKDYQKMGEVLGASFVIPKFDPNYIMSDYTFTNQSIFPTEQSVQDYLTKINSPLKNYSEQGKLASSWIFNASNGTSSSREGVTPRINPAVLLAYLEKENSLLSLSNYNPVADPDSRIQNAMGYGCPDNAGCNPRYAGFVNQINFGAFQLQYNFNLATSNQSDAFKLNNTIQTLDDYNVNLSNAATASSYRYTPHVYWGNYNLWKILTVNAWGISTQTYKAEDIDSYNLQYKVKPINNIIYTNIPDIDKILNDNYTFGDTGENINKLQTFLRQKGYFLGEITSYFGGLTKQALDSYIRDQKAIQLPTISCENLYTQTYNIGDTSDSINQLQQCLKDKKYFDYAITGYFGYITKSALDKYKNTNSSSVVTNISSNANYSLPKDCNYYKNSTWVIGQQNDQVKYLQQCLKDNGYYDFMGGITGYFGQYTKLALDQWKNTKPIETITINKSIDTSNIPYTTVLVIPAKNSTPQPNNQTTNQVSGLNTISSPKQNQISQSFSCDTYKKSNWNIGETSERVRILQICMQSVGKFTYSGGATGYFGDNTKQALISWRGYF